MEATLVLIIFWLLAILVIAAITTGRGIVLAGFVLGGLLGGLVGLGIGVAVAPGAEGGGMYGIGQAASGMVGGGIGLLGGAVVGSTAAWSITRKYER